MERAHRPRVARPARFFAPDLRAGATASLDADAAHHIRVVRLEPGDAVILLDGAGTVASGVLERIGRHDASVTVDRVETAPRPASVRLIAPLADRDRTLWLAEKATELAITSWCIHSWRRSASVGSSSSGAAFERKLRARMISALTQSGNAWLPEIEEWDTKVDATGEAPAGLRLVLDPEGDPILSVLGGGSRRSEIRADERNPVPTTIVVGPEGGLEADEIDDLVAQGFALASLGSTILRFETAAVAAIAIVRAVAAVPL